MGTKKEMYKIKDLSAKLIHDIEAMLNILDSNYGIDRNYFIEGGFVGNADRMTPNLIYINSYKDVQRKKTSLLDKEIFYDKDIKIG